MYPGADCALLRQLCERNAKLLPTADIVCFSAVPIEGANLFADKLIKVGDVQHIAHLVPFSAEPGIAEGSSIQMASRPQHDRTPGRSCPSAKVRSVLRSG